jgi:hypothetical protein
MTLLEKRNFVESEESSNRFSFNSDGKLIYNHNGEVVDQLSILVDFPQGYPFIDYLNIKEKPVVLKYGEYKDILPYLSEYSKRPDIFNTRIINVPLEMFKWVDIIFEISVSNWTYFLIDEIKEKGFQI